MGKGGGGAPQPTQQTVTQTNIPEYARPFFEDLMKRTQTASQQQYTPYTGDRVADFNADQNAAFDMARSMGSTYAGDLTSARGNLAQAGGIQAPNYGAASFDPTNIQAQQVQAGQFTDADMSGYMDPYLQNVLDRQTSEAHKSFAEGQSARDFAAKKAGAFGSGSRRAVADGIAQGQMEDRLANQQASTISDAFRNAQSTFMADRDAALKAGLSNQGADLTAQQYAEASKQFGANLSDSSARAAAQLGLQADTARSDAFLRQGLGQAQLGQTAAGLAGADLNARLGIGQLQQGQTQAGLEQAYQDFVNQRDWTRGQLGFYSGIMRGVPASVNSDVMSSAPAPNQMSQLLGSGIGALGLYKALQ